MTDSNSCLGAILAGIALLAVFLGLIYLDWVGKKREHPEA